MKRILKNDYILSTISKFFSIIFGFLSLVLLNRYLGATLKGEYSTLINYVTIISSIFQLGISVVYSKFKRKNIKNCFEIFVSLSFIQFMIYVLISLILIFIFGRNIQLFWILLISCIAILTTQLRYINLVEDIKYNTLVVIVMSTFNFVLTLVAFLFLEKHLYIGLCIYILKDLTIILMYLGKLKGKQLWRREYFKIYIEILKEGFLPMISSLLIMLNYKVDIVMLNQFEVDYALIGLYSLGLSISEYIWIIPDIFKDVVQKRTAKNNSIETINFSLRCSLTFVCLCYIVLLILGKNLFGIIFGREYIEAYKVTIILFFGIYSMCFYKIIGQLFISDNKSKQYFVILLVGAILNVICNYLLIPTMNIDGAAIASILSYSVIGIVFLILYLIQYQVNIKNVIFIQKVDIKTGLNFIKMREEKRK